MKPQRGNPNPETVNRKPLSVYFSILTLGITAVASQIILIREFFTVFYGNELSIGFILAMWLLGGAVGSGVLGYIFADKIRKKKFLFAFTQVALSLSLPASILFARISRNIFGVAVGEITSPVIFVAASAIAFLPISALLGFLFVLGCGMLPRRGDSENIGRVYALEALGAVLGGAITSFILIRYLGSLEIAFVVSGLNLMSSFVLTRKTEGHPSAVALLRGMSSLLILCLVGAWLFKGVGFLDRKSFDFKWAGFKVLESRDSIYGRVTVTRREEQINFYDNGLFLSSSHDPLSAEESVHFPMALSPNPKRVLLIGGGASEITAEILKYPVEKVDYVELDPLIISASKKFLEKEPFYRLNDPLVSVINEDGRFYIQNSKELYDVIIVNLPNPYTARINRFYTEEFFRRAKGILAKDGILAFSVSSSENYLSAEQARFLKSLYETAKAVFASAEIIPGDTAHFLVSPQKDGISLKDKKISERLASLGIETFYVRDYYLFSKLSAERLAYLRSALSQAEAVRRNTDFYPISYFYDFVLWSTYFSFRAAKIFMLLTEERLAVFALFIFLFLFVLFFFRRRKKAFKKEVTLLALSTTGLSEISFEILIVLAFQIIYGYLYYRIGVIIASFMLGLALGSFYITRRLAKIAHPFKAYIKVQLLVLIYPLLLIVFFKAFSVWAAYPGFKELGGNLFATLPLIAGFVGGMQYPLANRICLGEGEHVAAGKTGKTAGATYAVDLLGSFAGALLVSAFFVPVLGIANTCVVVAGLNLVSLALLLVALFLPEVHRQEA